MDPHRWQQVKALFDAVRDAPPGERDAALRAADADLRGEVQSLLAHHDRLGGYLETPAPAGGAATGVDPAATDAPGRVGPYRILHPIGSGGMGAVYLAEQNNPRRQVALKLLRAGAHSPGSVRRFRQEAALLARLHHPGIAQVIEAGATPAGQPFIAMEFVPGEPLTAFAREQRLSRVERLRLFGDVCAAVQYAHQKGVIHRDLKPSNILVTTDDATAGAVPTVDGTRRALVARPKVLDFGIARAIDGETSATTAQTHVGQLLGTLPYISPEQLGGDPLNIDTRADVYALGVILFELLTGRLPHDVGARPLPDAVRMVAEQDAPLAGSIDRTLRGDLETIVAKALEKDREQRYGSAAELAADLERFLRHEPIQARPPTTLYQLRKFARRNRGLVGAAAATLLALTAGIVGTTWQAVVATRATREARAAADRFESLYRFFAGMLAAVPAPAPRAGASAADEPAGRTVTLAAMLDRAAESVDQRLAGQENVQAVVHHTLGRAYYALRLYDAAEAEWRSALSLYTRCVGPDDAGTLTVVSNLGLLANARGRLPEAEALFDRALAAQRRTLGRDHPDVFLSMIDLLSVRDALGRAASADALRDEAGRLAPRVLAGAPRDGVIQCALMLGESLLQRDRFAAAMPIYEALLTAITRPGAGRDIRREASVELRCGACLEHLRRFEPAERHLRRALALCESFAAPNSDEVAEAVEALACLYEAQGRNAEGRAFRARLAATSRPADSPSGGTSQPARP
ncbi:MAG: serine/threonine-protein kinase [Phycisphaerae bacterium]